MSVQGEPYSRKVGLRIARPLATQAALKAVPAVAEQRANYAITVLQDLSVWIFIQSSTSAASASVLVPNSGSGRWHNLIPAGGILGGSSYKAPVRLATAGALAAYTRTGNVITANANGAIGNIDGVAPVAGDRILLTADGSASDVDNGIYVVTTLGDGATKFVLTRADDANATGEIVGGSIIPVQAGTSFGGELFLCSNAAAITLNTTAITFVQVPDLSDLASTASGLGASLIGIQDALNIITAATVEGALAENRQAIDATEANITTIGPGAPMQNRLRLLGAPGAAVEGNTVTIGADVFEFRSSTPPAGGTAGRIWVYNGANSAASRTNLINAINGVIDANTITYDGVLTETFLAAAGITTGDVIIRSASAAGGTVVPSATATACSDGLDTATDIWDSATCRFGRLAAPRQIECITVTLAAPDLAKGTIDVWFSFVPTRCIISNRMRQQNEAYVITGNAVSLTLAGGGSPNNQAADVLDIFAMA